MQPWLVFSLVTLLFFGFTGITQKLATNHVSFEASFIWFCISMMAVSALVALFVPLDWRLSPGLVALAALGGLLNGLGALTSFAAFEKGGKASIVIPIINLYPIVTILGAWLFLGEKVTLRQMAGILLALVAAVLLSMETPAAAPDLSQ